LINPNLETAKVKRTSLEVLGTAIHETQVQGALNHCSEEGKESGGLNEQEVLIYHKVVKIPL
jgi:hypothetical protein